MTSNMFYVPQFGEMSIPEAQGGTATYRALTTPVLQNGASIQTYIADSQCISGELPSRSIPSPTVQVDNVGHVTLIP